MGKSDYSLSNMMSDYLVNFVKNDNPNGEGLPIWNDIKNSKGKLMHFGNGECVEKKVKTSLVLEKIAKVENITVTDKEVEKELEKMAEQSKMSVEDIKKYVNVDDIKDSKLVEKTVDFVVKNAAVK